MNIKTFSGLSYSLINLAFSYVTKVSLKHNIDESHALKHSMDVFNYANNIFLSKIVDNPVLGKQHNVIAAAAILHDMCDTKYTNEKEELNNIRILLSNHLSQEEYTGVTDIISTISYSKVKKYGYPNLGLYNDAYHVVREADLLSGYDIHRCIIYGMMKEKLLFTDAVKRSIDIYNERMGTYIYDNLFISNYSINKSTELDIIAKENINTFKKLIF